MFIQPFIEAQIKENIKAPRHWLCAGKSPVTDEFPAERASNAENVSIWWRHHAIFRVSDAIEFAQSVLDSITNTTVDREAVIAQGEAILEEIRNRSFSQNEADAVQELQYARECGLFVLILQFPCDKLTFVPRASFTNMD